MASSSRRTSNHSSQGGDDYDSHDDKEKGYSSGGGRGGKKVWWSAQATEYYIRLLEKYKEKLWSPEAQAARYTVKNSSWADLTQEMVKAGHQFTEPQCRMKVENLKRGFITCTPRKLVKSVNVSNGSHKKVESTCRRSRKWPFYSQFLPIMNYIIANKVGSDRLVALQRAAPILEAARIDGHLDNLDTNTIGNSSSLPSHNSSIDEDEVSITEDLFASEYNHYTNNTNTNGIENGHSEMSEITSIVASAFDNSDLGYGSESMRTQSIGGSQDYYQMQSFNSQPNTDGDIMIQVLDPLGTLKAPVKVEQVHDYDCSQYETGADSTDMEQEPPPLTQIDRITAPTTATRSLPILSPKPPVEVATPQECQEAAQVLFTKIAKNIVTPALEATPAATTSTEGSTKVSTSTSSTPPTTSTVSSATPGPNTSGSLAKVSSPVPAIPDAGGARRLSSRAQKPTEKLREYGLLKSPTKISSPTKSISFDLITSFTSSAPAAKKARSTSTSTTATAVVPHVEPKSESKPPAQPTLTPAAKVPPSAPSQPQPPELQNALLEEMQGLRQELRTVNRNLEEMIAARNRMNDILNRFLAAQHSAPSASTGSS